VERRAVETDTTLSRAKEIMTRSIFARLDAAIVKCQMAKSPVLKADTLVRSAQKTYDEFDRFVWRFKLKHHQFDQITAKMERLRFEIEAVKLVRK
jgi:hypothetical protein